MPVVGDHAPKKSLRKGEARGTNETKTRVNKSRVRHDTTLVPVNEEREVTLTTSSGSALIAHLKYELCPYWRCGQVRKAMLL